MKQSLVLTVLLGAAALHRQPQCNKTVQLRSSKTSFLNASYAAQNTKDENVVVDITKTTITITPNGNTQDAMSGAIKESTCDWKVPNKEGKMVIKSDLVDGGGDVKEATITIESKDRKTTLLAEVKEHPGQKIRIDVDKFEEKE